MSRIKTLEIRGIRSFDPNDTQTIQFYTPLTLIVGKNGCGKTTLIECLKYATTGEQPPNTKSGAFVNDPSITGVSKVKAQVRLTFYNIRGRRMQVLRGLEVTQNKNTKTQKTNQSTLLAIDPKAHAEMAPHVSALVVLAGLSLRATTTDTLQSNVQQETSITTKCSQLDADLPLNLGVSAAILESVIFCHQEDSFWPLSEPSVLKKKFDDIFAATRYTKALDHIKVLRKEKGNALKVEENELEHLKLNYSKAGRVRERKEEVVKSMTQTDNRIAVLDGGEIERLVEQMTSLMDQHRSLQSLRAQLDSSRLERDMIKKNMDSIKENLELYHESDEQLQGLLRQYLSNIDEQNERQEELDMTRSGVEAELSMIDSDLSRRLTERGQFQAETNAHERKMSELTALVNQLMAHYGLSGNFASDPVSNAHQVVLALESKIQQLTSAMESWKAEKKAKESTYLTDIQNMKAIVASHEETRKMFKRQMESCKDKIKGIQRDIGQYYVSETELNGLKVVLQEEEAALTALNAAFSPGQSELQLKSLATDLQTHELKLMQINEEMSTLSNQSSMRARLELKQAERDRKKLSLVSMQEPANQSFASILGVVPEPALLERKLSEALLNKENSLKNVREQSAKQGKEFSGIDSMFQMVKKAFDAKSTELEHYLNQIRAICGHDNYPEARQAAEEEYQNASKDSSTISSASSMYYKFKTKFMATKCCALCARGFDDSEEESQFLQRLERLMSKIPDAIRERNEELEKAEATRAKLQDLQAAWDSSQRLATTEIPELKKRLAELTSQKASLSESVDDLHGEVALLENEVKATSSAINSAKQITQLANEINAIDKEIQALQNELAASGSIKTMGEIQQEQQEVQAKCQSLRKSIDSLNKDLRDKQREIQSKDALVRTAREDLTKAEAKLAESQKMSQSIIELNDEIRKLQLDLENQEELVSRHAPVIQNKEKELTVFQKQMSSEESLKVADVSEVKQSMSHLARLEKEVQRFIEEGGPDRLEANAKEIKRLEELSATVKQTLLDLAQKIDNMTKQRSEVQVIQRTIDDNLKYRQMIKDSDALETKCSDLKKKISDFDTASIEAQYNKLKQSHANLVGERAGLVGELKQLQEQAKRLDLELSTDYLDIESEYKKQLILVKTEKMASDDLEKYSKALDRAIVKFHSMKLQEINDIIKELWMKTYRGNDIETIEIRSDVETTRGNRSYNYRVVMVKNQAELDMRGRCSAGQKVLACLIIRLALAETFCLNCGILALDEPTTNLDIANMESLAESLASIIAVRKDQKNFQLIVITHDEKFMEMLGRSEYTDYIWRVSKDDDGFSRVTREAVTHSAM